MAYKPGGSYYGEFTTSNPTTGAAANADSLPTATANHNGADDTTNFPLTVTNIDTGRYKVTGTIPSGYAAGDVVNISVAATCSSVSGKQVIERFILDSIYLSQVPTVAQIATAVWQDATAGDFTTAGSVGKFVMSQLAGAFVGTTSVYASAALVNAPAGGSGGGSVVLAANGLDSVIVETGLNARQALAILAAESAGKLAGATGGTITFAGAGVSTNRITATVDGSGNRTAVVLTPPT